MARTVDSIIKAQLGSLLAQVAVLTAQLEEAQESIVQLTAAAEAAKPAESVGEKHDE